MILNFLVLLFLYGSSLVLNTAETIWKRRILIDLRDKKVGRRTEYEEKDSHVGRVRIVQEYIIYFI